jgi:predicted nuclease of predicted toxin-antitoxin system
MFLLRGRGVIFLLDENFPKSAAEMLRGKGHTVHDFREMGLSGSSDKVVVEKAQEFGAVILSTDRDFFHTLSHQYAEHAGVVVIALRKPSRAAILERLEWFIGHVPEVHWARRAFQLRDSTWLAKPPIESDKEPLSS